MNPITFFDLFSGVGGFRAGLELAGGYECVGHCEIDKHADRAYRSLFNIKESEVYYEDARRINPNTLPDFDLLTAGFPCQSFSLAGRRQGFLDPRGTLFFEIARLVRARQPSYVLLENVHGLLSHDEGRTFAAVLDTLCKLGYSVEFQVLNSANFGVPQSRKRVFIIGYLGRGCAGAVLPFQGATEPPIVQPITVNSETPCLLIKEATGRGYKEAFPGDSVDLSYVKTNTRRGRVGRGIAHTLDTSSSQGVVMPDGRIRRLMPREYFRLQGFSDGQIDQIIKTASDTHLYRMAGNAVTVNVVHALALRLKTAHEAAVAATGAKEEQAAA